MKKFPVPSDFQIPDGVEPGQSFETVATLSMGDDGMLMLVAIDGSAIMEEEEDDSEVVEAPPEDPDFVQSVMNEMGA